MDTMINVLLVHEMPLMSNVIASALEDEREIQVVGSARNVEEALLKIQQDDIDVTLISSRLPDQGSLRLINAVKAQNPSVDLIVIGVTETRERVLRYVEAGASGYVAKDGTIEEMISAIQLAQQEKAIMPPRITAAMMDRLSEYAEIFSDLEISVVERAGLTNREMEVLELLGKNMSNYEIAEALVIEVGTVKNHVHSILDKLKVTSRHEAATYLALIRR
jgi:two-component system NarL family response regulator